LLFDTTLALLSSVESNNYYNVLPLSPELLDSDLFTLLYLVNNLASVAIQQGYNVTRYVAPPAEEDVDSQESTPAPASRPFLDSNYLALRSSDTDKRYWTLGRRLNLVFSRACSRVKRDGPAWKVSCRPFNEPIPTVFMLFMLFRLTYGI
jgi:hypothetical protein